MARQMADVCRGNMGGGSLAVLTAVNLLTCTGQASSKKRPRAVTVPGARTQILSALKKTELLLAGLLFHSVTYAVQPPACTP